MRPLLSIVSGTYNRFQHMTKMVESVRLSIGVGISYEIVLVDGGSTDGTIEWCEQQSDIVLIKQGKLLGAVKAFQAGFEVAKGAYVVIGNDDIVYVDESIRTALAFMEDNPKVGIGCFYQDRYGKPWHVEHMSVVVDGKQSHMPYGQVCIIPKELGDLAGWWGKDYHTYAGDNELSCNVLEIGFQVEPIPCACIHDSVAEDELRKANDGGTLHEKPHPDSTAWVKKWTRKGLLGPVIPHYQEQRIFDRQPRILYAPIYEKNFPIQHKSKRGLREALTRAGYIVSEVDYVDNPAYLYDAANAITPDIILTQVHDTAIYKPADIRLLKLEQPQAILINWNGDYFPQNFFNSDYMAMMKTYDLATFVTPDVGRRYDPLGIKWAYWQIGYEESVATPDKSTERFDVLFLGNGHYPFRVQLGEVLRSLQNVSVGIYGTWPAKFQPNGRNLYDYDAGHKLYMAAKIAISDGRPGTNFVSNRIFQSMYAGCFTLQQWFPTIYDMLDYQEGVHFVTYKETHELPELIKYWLAHDTERNKIAKAGQQQTLHKHSFDRRVEKFNKMIKELANARITT